jgi:hypothetical protein
MLTFIVTVELRSSATFQCQMFRRDPFPRSKELVFLTRWACPLHWSGTGRPFFEQDVGRSERSVTARDVLLQFEVP